MPATKRKATPTKAENLTGQQFGHLNPLQLVRPPKGAAPATARLAHWLCLCQLCGSTCVVRAKCLKSGHTRSCGCLRRDARAKREIRLKLPAERRAEIARLGALATNANAAGD